MPKRTDIEKILIIGSGPIIIGQACEFDYSGTQACKALREEGYRVVLVNSNPATIMTDPEFADSTYVEPITPDMVRKVIERERPDALLPTMGGQTALNVAVMLAEDGTLEHYGVELIGAKLPAIKKAEDRDLFKAAMEAIGLEVPQSGYAGSREEAYEIIRDIPYPVIIRPSFTLGGTGGNVAHDEEEFSTYVDWGLSASPFRQILIEESVIGWKEFELEVMRDLKDNVVIICSIENFDPMGVHTGDSITVAPAQTLTDKEYQIMRDAAIAIIREIGVETGGSNIQFAVEPSTGELVVIEMNPRVSRSSALASKATGFPIAKMAAKLAVGLTLDEIPNDITKETPASFEPTIDYCVVKIPRFAFEKFPEADQTLTTQMKSVGEVMAIGRTFKEALLKAVRSLEIDRYSLTLCGGLGSATDEDLVAGLATPNWERTWYIAEAMRRGWSLEDLWRLTKIDAWFLANVQEIVDLEERLGWARARWVADGGEPEKVGDYLTADVLKEAKAMGAADAFLGKLFKTEELAVRELRHRAGVNHTFKLVDTCGAEFEAYTPYLYSTYESECEADPSDRRKIMILGAGPNRIGQGIEFDYCCVHGVFALKDDGFETIMVNCNPETVSTDYDTSDRLYFEPLTLEDVLNIVETERPEGVIVQFGGQTPLKLAIPLERAGVKIIGTSPDAIDRAEDRERFKDLIERLGLRQPENGTATSFAESCRVASRIGYPVVVRPSYVLGGRAMEIVYDEESLEAYMSEAVRVSPDHPILIDKFLEEAQEVDVDAVSDGERVVIGGLMEHIEEAGVHSGDSACSLPPYRLEDATAQEIARQTEAIALELGVVGLINIQFAVQNGETYLLEVNPRASRTVPFVSKATGVPWAKVAARLMAGKTLEELGLTDTVVPSHYAVKEAVFPFIKFPGVDTVLGPEMKSTGEVMGIDATFDRAFAKAQLAAVGRLPMSGTVFISVKNPDKRYVVPISQQLHSLGFKLIATRGTQRALAEAGVPAELVLKATEGSPNIVDSMEAGQVDLVINTTHGKQALKDSYTLRRTALARDIPYTTTIWGAEAVVKAIRDLLVAMKDGTFGVRSLQEHHGAARKKGAG
jgi:carbamoyl-phosphate synthase large subunit